jgi:2,5-diketo-D-gluconate reductase A
MTAVPSVVLNNGVEVPLLGFGAFQMTDLDECERSVRDALDVGYRLLDTAASYGNEEAVGRAIKSSGLDREEVSVTRSCGSPIPGHDRGLRAFERSLERLGLDYLGLSDPPALRRCVRGVASDGGAVRAGPGARDRREQLLPRPCHALPHAPRRRAAVDQVETHPFHQQREAQVFLRDNGVQMESWGPFA